MAGSLERESASAVRPMVHRRSGSDRARWSPVDRPHRLPVRPVPPWPAAGTTWAGRPWCPVPAGSPVAGVSARSGLVEGAPEVGDEVVRGLDTDGQAHERLRDLEGRARHRGVGHDGRQLDERLDPAE